MKDTRNLFQKIVDLWNQYLDCSTFERQVKYELSSERLSEEDRAKFFKLDIKMILTILRSSHTRKIGTIEPLTERAFYRLALLLYAKKCLAKKLEVVHKKCKSPKEFGEKLREIILHLSGSMPFIFFEIWEDLENVPDVALGEAAIEIINSPKDGKIVLTKFNELKKSYPNHQPVAKAV